ncbi:uncharacterized protein N0V89_000654 [Didymosphaeria variabile]|uniref:Protein kinase domain-containing protein n=1 Tax=Didymosphaeria variabile TaxID=1932322 RepID=A0A9W9CG21_9PLEO|nr:uncharacterized protein N0V89_000654 [Didymosphaeria variabile]KAJ4360095.1 hypothetical protein N0V89_000654 [Didymosphaeria variabile]
MSERKRRSLSRAAETYDLVPPPAEFRIVQNTHKTATSREWLCLPRHMDTALAADPEAAHPHDDGRPASKEQEEPTVVLPTDDHFDENSSVAEFNRGPETGPFTGNILQEALAKLVVVKMHARIDTLTNESEILKILHDLDRSEAFVGAWVVHEVISWTPISSWVALRPIFGKTLDAFGQACLDTNRMPTYFVWHIFLSMMSALEFVHGAEISHGAVSGANFMLQCSSPGGQSYHDWPDVVLTGFHAADLDIFDNGKSEDVEKMAKIMYNDVITRWSDAGLLMHFIVIGTQRSDSLMKLAAALKALTEAPAEGKSLSLGDLQQWRNIAVAERAKGGCCPLWIKSAAYDPLITEELEEATRPPLVLTFGPNSEKFKRWDRARRTPVALRKRQTRHRGTEKHGLLVIKFELRRDKFANLVNSVRRK